MRGSSGGRLTMNNDSFQSQSQQNNGAHASLVQQGLQAAYESNLAISHQLQQQNSSEDGSLEHKFNVKSVNGDPARSLPTPEMSPVEAASDKQDMYHQQQQHIRFAAFSPNSIQSHGGGQSRQSFGENPVSQLISRFSDTSSFLRNVCPPYRVRGPPPSNDDVIHYQSMDQVPNVHSKANYEYQVPAHLAQQAVGQHEIHWSPHSMPHSNNVQYSPVDQACLYTYGHKHELKSSNESPYHESLDSQMHILYADQQQQYMSSGEHQAHPNSHGPYDGHANLMALQQHVHEQGDYDRHIIQNGQQHLQQQQHHHQQQVEQQQQMGGNGNGHVQAGHQQPHEHFSHLVAKLTEFRPQATANSSSSAGLVPTNSSCDSEGSQELLATLAEARKIISN